MKKSHIIPASINKRLISTLMATRKVDPKENKDFALKSSSEFASRSGDVFGKLLSLENQHKTWVTENETLECFEESDERFLPEPTKPTGNTLDSKFDSKVKSVIVFRKPDSVPKPDSDAALFKKPYPAKYLKRNAVPSFKKQPQKWTKYSLEDVPISSDATNAKAAFQFLNELKSRKEEKFDPDQDNSSDKIMFKKPKIKERNATARSKTRLPPLTIEELGPDSSNDEDEVLNKCKNSGNVLLAHLKED
ncbi:hypothetical protein JTE90_021785 [Oedothorax gibbosus]|uniref:U5 small nuclear ribonucleoprotein TSSC4 n=1 Tax=Oedothorax gibbosus TaxID=931172 RepID=A0AAV6UQ92_9ARAC|nr:hypothetical protein JTE90_021785 [Oedothorax gibbosus]